MSRKSTMHWRDTTSERVLLAKNGEQSANEDIKNGTLWESGNPYEHLGITSWKHSLWWNAYKAVMKENGYL